MTEPQLKLLLALAEAVQKIIPNQHLDDAAGDEAREMVQQIGELIEAVAG